MVLEGVPDPVNVELLIGEVLLMHEVSLSPFYLQALELRECCWSGCPIPNSQVPA